MINVSQQRALLQRIMAECDRLARERTSQADQYTDGYLAALTAIDAYCTRLDNGMWKP